jgi:demethylmenaquinone methyltransferase/2-methoxy-6-polyprenyl-1,4-benzoquinol methylase
MSAAPVDFGYTRVAAHEKTARVGRVFSSVAGNYDRMNDLMSFGLHRLWKRGAVLLAAVRRGMRVLDLAGGTGDVSALLEPAVGEHGLVVLSDINRAMLGAGRDRLATRGRTPRIALAQADAERLPFAPRSFDRILIAFGLRNVTDKPVALRAMHDALAFGGCVVILEFSALRIETLRALYDRWSFDVIPELGALVAGDRDSYRYLVESIRMHPGPEALAEMLRQAGFANVTWNAWSGGIVAVHRGWKL